jgi:hypothetical protein
MNATVTPHPPRVRAERASLEAYLESVAAAGQLERPLLVSFTQWDFAVGAVAETAMTLNGMGSRVSVALWSDRTPLRDVGWQVQNSLCTLFRSPSIDQRLEEALLAAGLPPGTFVTPPIKKWRPAERLDLGRDRSRGAIRQLAYRGSRMGRAIVQVPPSKETPTSDTHVWPKRYLDRAARSYAYVYDQSLQLMRDLGTTCLISYNGRFLHDRAAAAAAETLGIPVLSYDQGGLETDFELTRDALHDWDAFRQRMLAMYRDWPIDERDEIGSAWFEDRMTHRDPTNRGFTDGQVIGQGVAPDPSRPTVVYFSSSNDEVAELEIDWASYYGNQAGALHEVAAACRELGYRLVVRTHPHKRIKPTEDLQEWLSAVAEARPDVHFDQDSDVDSYTLMRQADIVVTYVSTTGVEAAFASRPVLVMGPAFYSGLPCVTPATTPEALRAALTNPIAGDLDSAVAVGLMVKRRGFAYSFVQWDGRGPRTLAGVPIEEPRELVRHLSDRWRRIHSAWLARQ